MSSSNGLTDEHLAKVLSLYLVRPDPRLFEQIRAYIDVLSLWNRKISLTTITNLDEIVRFHFGESFVAAPTFGITRGRLADLGSGAGFPGLPLKLLQPALDVTLIEANAKKAAFLAEVSRQLGLEQVIVSKKRIEASEETQPFDIITARALGSFEEILSWSHQRLAPQGKLLLWLGRDDTTEIARHHTEWRWLEPVKIPGSEQRFILEGTLSGGGVPRGTC